MGQQTEIDKAAEILEIQVSSLRKASHQFERGRSAVLERQASSLRGRDKKGRSVVSEGQVAV